MKEGKNEIIYGLYFFFYLPRSAWLCKHYLTFVINEAANPPVYPLDEGTFYKRKEKKYKRNKVQSIIFFLIQYEGTLYFLK